MKKKWPDPIELIFYLIINFHNNTKLFYIIINFNNIEANKGMNHELIDLLQQFVLTS